MLRRPAGRRVDGEWTASGRRVDGEWTAMKIVVAGTTARVFVNGATRPCLVVTDLKHGDRSGSVALWAHAQPDAYVGGLTVTRR
ncbi:MAG: hypothetical protein ABI910_22645 [Gemmatimonadota bacterium]